MKKYELRPLKAEELGYRVTWLNDPRVYSSMHIQVPITLEDTKRWFKKVSQDNTRVDLVLLENGYPIAMSGLTNFQNGVAEGYTFVNPDLKGRGIGKITLFLRMVYAFDIFKVEKVKSFINDNNVPSIKAVQRLGFKFHKKEVGIRVKGELIQNSSYICSTSDFNRGLYNYDLIEGSVIFFK